MVVAIAETGKVLVSPGHPIGYLEPIQLHNCTIAYLPFFNILYGVASIPVCKTMESFCINVGKL